MFATLVIAWVAAAAAAGAETPPQAHAEPVGSASSADVEELVRALREGDRRARLEAIAALPEYGQAAVAPLAEALADRVIDVRREAARALAALGPLATPAAPELVRAGSDEEEPVRREAWRALGCLGPDAADALSTAAVELGPPHSLRALLALGRLDADAPEVLAAALPVLVREGATPGERAAAVAVVVRAGTRAQPDLTEALVHPAAEARAAAAVALGLVGSEDARVRGALIAATEDDDADVRRRAVWALGRLGSSDVDTVAALAKSLEDESLDVQHAAVWALGRAGAAGVPTLLAVERALWGHAVTALGTLDPAAAEEPLFELITSDDTAVERSLSGVLPIQRWGPRARHLAPRLARLLDHSRTWMRIAALRALNWTGYDQPAIADLLELALQHEDARIRAPAAAALGYATGRDDTLLLTMARMLGDDPDERVRRTLAWVLGGFTQDPELVVPALVQALDDEDAIVRREAARSVAQIGPRAFPAARRLVQELVPGEDGDAEFAEAAREALLAMNSEATTTLIEYVRSAPSLETAGAAMEVLLRAGAVDHEELRELSRDDRVLVRVLATRGLLEHGLAPTKALKTFIDGVKDRHDVVRIEGARALAALGSTARTASSALSHALDDSLPPVRVELVRAIAAVDGDRRSGVQALVQTLEDDPDVTVRAAAAECLGDLGEQARRALPALLAALEHEEADLRVAAATAVGRIAPDTRSAAEALRARLERDDSVAVRRAAAIALGHLPEPGEDVLAALRTALEDEDPDVAAGAAIGLGFVGPAATADVPRLVDHLLADPSRSMRVACAEALAELAALAHEATPALALAVEFAEERTRLDPLLSTSFEEDPPLRPFDEDELESDTSWLDVRVAAARALGAVGPAAADAVPALERALLAGDPRLAEASLQAIARIRP